VHSSRTYLVVVRGSDKYDGSIARNVKSASGADFTEEDVDNETPEKNRGIIAEFVRMLGGTHVSNESVDCVHAGRRQGDWSSGLNALGLCLGLGLYSTGVVITDMRKYIILWGLKY